VYSNDPVQPVTTLTLRADVDAEVAADPPQLYVGHVRRGEAVPNALRLVTAETATISIGPIETSGRVVTSVPSAGNRVNIAVRPDAPFGTFHEAITVHTSSASRPVVSIPVTGIVEDEPSSTPAAPEPRK
jgi:hypothetical protein